MGGLERQNTLLQRFAQSNEQRHALQIALYNTTLFVLLAGCVLGLVALYNMLYMFLAPMMWAVLVGTLLFPAKRRVTQVTQDWLTSLEESHTPLVLGLLLLPYRSFVLLSESIYAAATGEYGLYYLGAYGGLKLLSYDRTFLAVLGWLGRIYLIFDSAISFCSRSWVLPLMVVYVLGYAAWIFLQPREAINKKFARSLSVPIWVYVLCAVSSVFGPLQVVVFGGSSVALLLLASGAIHAPESPPATDNNEPASQELLDEKERLLAESTPSPASSSTSVGPAVTAVAAPSSFTGSHLIWWTFCLVSLLWVVRHDSALVLILIPLLFAILTKFGETAGFCSWVSSSASSLWETAQPSVSKFVDITIAGPLRQFVKMVFTSDQWLLSSLRLRMDLLSSVIVMSVLALGALFFTIFCCVQLHSETVHLARLTSNVMSSRPDWLASALNYTEDRLEEQNIDIDDYVEQAYKQGRAWLASNVRSLADPKDTERADQLERHVNQMVDNVYRMWEEKSGNGGGEGTTELEEKDWMQQIRAAADLHALREELTHLVKNNVDTLVGVAHSVWAVLLVNISLLGSVLSAFAGLILGFGLDMLNFFIECIVFLTMVYYLLASSGDRWLPLEYLSRLGSFLPSLSVASPSSSSTANGPDSANSPHGFTTAIEDAIFGVFGLSGKMAVFYGLYTYFIHSLFDLNIVFVPSMLATLFAAIPLFPPWSVCVFGLIELGLVRLEMAATAVFALLSIAPLAVADAKFYSEVKGMHPYVTGLSVIGGMYWLGLQGAIIGPIILCSFLVLLNIYTQLASA